MIHEILPVGLLQCNCSILGDETSREAIVIDPGDEISRIVALLDKHHLTVKQIIITQAPILYNQLDLPLVQMMDIQAGWLGIPTPKVSAPDDNLRDGQTISIIGLTGS